MTFASGATVRDGSAVQPARLWTRVNRDEPDSREVMGFVRWENGVPAVKVAVFMQNRYNFRKYVRRVETDEHGYFRFSNVPGDEPYFMFSIPPGEGDIMRSMEYFGVGALQREVWHALELHPHRVTGSLADAIKSTRRNGEGTTPDQSVPAGITDSAFQLIRLEGKTESVIWTFRAEPSGEFSVANVPHGRFCVQVSHNNGGTVIRSLPFDVGDGQSETTVRWPSP